eukprot:m.247673 g.247673  ORF g.247673 m.247673 type:complete len:74 (+) comp15398_c0_seq5:881-1102(+)
MASLNLSMQVTTVCPCTDSALFKLGDCQIGMSAMLTVVAIAIGLLSAFWAHLSSARHNSSKVTPFTLKQIPLR